MMDNIRPIIDFLSGHVKITTEEMEKMLSIIHFSAWPKNEVIQKEGDIPRTLAFILKGAVRTYYVDDKGHEHTVNFTFENQPLVAFDSFANQTPAGVSALTLEPTEIIYTSHAEFFGFMESFPRYEPVIRNIMGQYLVLESEHSKLLRINPARERYEALCKARPELIARVPLKYIASYIGMTLETVSRIRAGKL
jgi:CRP-like cAMP-binding protein